MKFIITEDEKNQIRRLYEVNLISEISNGPNSEQMIERFLEMTGVNVSINIDRKGHTRNGPFVCMEIKVFHDEELNYHQYHCYEFKKGKVTYSEGNKIYGVEDGILSYLNQDIDIENYLENLARSKAKKYFEYHFT